MKTMMYIAGLTCVLISYAQAATECPPISTVSQFLNERYITNQVAYSIPFPQDMRLQVVQLNLKIPQITSVLKNMTSSGLLSCAYKTSDNSSITLRYKLMD